MFNKKTVFSILSVAIMVIVTLAASYAYFTAGITGGESASTIIVTGGEMSIAYAGGDKIEVFNIYPKADAWITKSFSVTGTNTTDIEMKYELSLEVVTNTFTTNALSYSLTGYNPDSNGETAANITSANIATGESSTTLGTGKFVKANAIVHTYDFKLYFLDNGGNQNDDQEAKFAGYIKIVGIE